MEPATAYGHAIIFQLVIREFRSELTIDLCQESPRTVLMAIADLERRADELVEAMKIQMTNNPKEPK